MISIGSVLKGPELSGLPIGRAIIAAIKATEMLRGEFEFGNSPAINVVFYVPGSTGRLDWEGMRDSKFSRQEQLLMIQVAVPEKIVQSTTPSMFIIESLYGANAIAFEFFRQKGIHFPLGDAEKLVSEIEANIRNSA
jgi:hypothetical protein